MSTYMTEYRCRRCDTIFKGSTGTSSRETARRSAAGWQMPNDGVPVDDTADHECKDGGIGRADLQGFQKEEEG